MGRSGLDLTAREVEPPVLEWRRELLLAAGFARAEATRLALDRRTDLHSLLELTDRGCPPHLAVRILAPLDGEGEA